MKPIKTRNKLTPETVNRIYKCVKSDMSSQEIADVTGISYATTSRISRIIRFILDGDHVSAYAVGTEGVSKPTRLQLCYDACGIEMPTEIKQMFGISSADNVDNTQAEVSDADYNSLLNRISNLESLLTDIAISVAKLATLLS